MSEPRYRAIQHWQSDVHGGGSTSFSFGSNRDGAISFVNELMPSRVYYRAAQILENGRWKTIHKRSRRALRGI